MHEEVLLTKVANALIEDVRISNVVAPVAGPVLSLYRAAWGGLWVGGRVTLTTSTVRFSPNAINRLVQSGDLDVSIRLAAIDDIQVVPGFVTNIVVLTTPQVIFKVRCWGARRFADAVREARTTTA